MSEEEGAIDSIKTCVMVGVMFFIGCVTNFSIFGASVLVGAVFQDYENPKGAMIAMVVLYCMTCLFIIRLL